MCRKHKSTWQSACCEGHESSSHFMQDLFSVYAVSILTLWWNRQLRHRRGKGRRRARALLNECSFSMMWFSPGGNFD